MEAALATQGLALVLPAILAAGVLYGFAGFGSALLFLPLATALLPPPVAVAAFAVASIGSVATVLPGAWAVADRRAVLLMAGSAALAMPLGVWLLRAADPVAVRWAVSAVVAATLASMAAGLRVRVGPGAPARAAVGAASGLVGGATGLLGPVVILVGLSDRRGAAVMRANLAAFLTLMGVVLLAQLALQGALEARALRLGLLCLPLYTLGTLLGRRLFDPARERLHRRLAYAVVAASVVIGLPVFD